MSLRTFWALCLASGLGARHTWVLTLLSFPLSFDRDITDLRYKWISLTVKLPNQGSPDGVQCRDA